MSLIIHVALPDLDSDRAALLCLFLEKQLALFLDAAQLARIRQFPLHGKALFARLSRLLARAAALRALPTGEKILARGLFFSSSPGAFCLSFSHPPGLAVAALIQSASAAVDSEMIDAKTLAGFVRFMRNYAPKVSITPASHIVRVWTIFETAVKLLGSDAWDRAARDVFRAEFRSLKWRGRTRVCEREIRWFSYKNDNFITTFAAFSDQPDTRPTLASANWRDLAPGF